MIIYRAGRLGRHGVTLLIGLNFPTFCFGKNKEMALHKKVNTYCVAFDTGYTIISSNEYKYFTFRIFGFGVYYELRCDFEEN